MHDFEKENGQIFIIDAVINTQKIKGHITDKIEDTVSYSEIIKLIKKVMLQEKHNLIESVANEILKSLFENFKDVSRVSLTLKKPQAPIKEDFEYVGIKIEEERRDFFNGKSGVITGE